ncbi:hypothetical protein SCL_0444 [Sulfuricaulis limicola]|uniref:Uncharacterized protein n=1 Tax=Sulfuricaulis limicola TaxID=1620215 RepID=A0A1B4XDA2_9GAMM|nr:hypothetical protein [Sulfuricaulis limicola]BAV32766.1 hypothetical protein SCL_0444 [Sulfuricaulis limicola]
MAAKRVVSPEEIVAVLNKALAESAALEGDCRECQVRRVGRVTDEEARQLGRNWNVDMVNGECGGECYDVLVDIAREVGGALDASWS